MPIDFAIRMKCGLITEPKMFIEPVFFKFLLHIITELFGLSLISCSYGVNDLQLWPERPAVCRVSLPNVSLLPAKLSLEVSGSPYLFFL